MSHRPGGDPDDASAGHRSLLRLLRDLGNDAVELVRQEIALLRLEIRENAQRIGRHAAQTAIGGVIAVVGVLVLVQFLIIGLGVALGGAYWLSSLLVAIGLLIVGAGLAFLGVRRVQGDGLSPRATLETTRETREWAGRELSELRAALSGASPADDRERGLPLQAPSGVALAPAAHAAGKVTSVEADRGIGRRSHPVASAERGSSPGDTRLPITEPIRRRVLHVVSEVVVLGQAAKVAFYMFTSLPPALLVLFSLAGIYGGESLAAFLTEQIEMALPGGANDPNSAAGFLSEFVTGVVTDSAPGPLSIGLVLGIWAASAVFVALTVALNRAFDVREGRSWLRRRALALVSMVVFVLLFLGGSVLLIGGPLIADAMRLGGNAELAWNALQWPLAFLLIVAAFFLVYYLLPNRDQSAMKGALIRSSALAAALWVVATAGFRLYIVNFGSYGETYGVVGAILVLLLWMYITAIVILFGGEVASEMERSS